MAEIALSIPCAADRVLFPTPLAANMTMPPSAKMTKMRNAVSNPFRGLDGCGDIGVLLLLVVVGREEEKM